MQLCCGDIGFIYHHSHHGGVGCFVLLTGIAVAFVGKTLGICIGAADHKAAQKLGMVNRQQQTGNSAVTETIYQRLIQVQQANKFCRILHHIQVMIFGNGAALSMSAAVYGVNRIFGSQLFGQRMENMAVFSIAVKEKKCFGAISVFFIVDLNIVDSDKHMGYTHFHKVT